MAIKILPFNNAAWFVRVGRVYGNRLRHVRLMHRTIPSGSSGDIPVDDVQNDRAVNDPLEQPFQPALASND